MSSFKDLADVTVREEKTVQKSDLNKILDIEKEMIDKYSANGRLRIDYDLQHELYQVFKKEVQEKIRDITPTIELLQEYITSRENSEKTDESLLRGMYSAVLLETVCAYTQIKSIIFDGKGREWNYLFYHVQNANNISVQHFNGEWILAFAGFDKGKIRNLSCSNIQGSDTLAGAGANGGSIEHVICSKIKGSNTLYDAGAHGSIKYATINEIEGHSTLGYIGNNGGNASHITCTNMSQWSGLLEGVDIRSNLILEDDSFEKNRLLNTHQKEIINKITQIVETIHTLSLEEQKKAHDEIARLQTEIFAGET